MTSEFDPLFIKGLRLLHSKSKDSTDQLKQLLDEMILQSKQSNSKDKIYTTVKLDGENKLHIKKASSVETAKYSSEDNRKSEKRNLEKLKQDSMESEAKIPKLEPPQVYSYYPSSPPDLPKLDQYVTKKEEETESSDDNADADDFAMEMGLACVICNQIEVTQGNQLIECQECHSLYHQECHRPPATDYDYNDPRRVWYCAKCVKNMKKMATKTQKTAKSGISVPSKEPVSQTKCSKSESSPPSLILPFKRTELKTQANSQANNQVTAANKPIGLAGLAANFGGRTTASVSTASAAPRSVKISTSNTSLKTPFSSTSKTSSVSTAITTKSSFQSLASTTSSSTSSQKPSTTTTATKGLGLLSAVVASVRSAPPVAAAAPGNGNSAHKVASCSPLMSADKRLQIMKKKASKQQERRRLSTK
ncbi:integrator complex subunit 12 [Parasteatoda tepidariorum]|nr:integrator complex subunit 12 [Parasteatoda tepidariorum]XP_015904516.1 integrator complex subunit 12 [Parasteatoda tepidariorum]XP_015904517.1 integrator complex subunit 12 [Parasteatoda tepidariorum]XP_015904518.1 integrator complex subunit 12 [Parasteatoda tepidariorum]